MGTGGARVGRWSIALALASALPWMVSQPAGAAGRDTGTRTPLTRSSNFVTQLGATVCCVADSSVHDWAWDPTIDPVLQGPILDTLYNSYGTTDLTIQAAGSHSDSVDVYYYQVGLRSFRALTTCAIRESGPNRCDHFHVRFDLEAMRATGTGPMPYWFVKAIACHETGHSVGLVHPDQTGQDDTDPTFGCMTSDPPLTEYLRPHNVAHINEWY